MESAAVSSPYSIALAGESSAVFPYISDFGSLDTALVPENIKQMIGNFFSDFKAMKNCEIYFEKDKIFSLVFFLKDISENTGYDTPGKYFSSYLLGAPFSSSDGYEIPVRIFFKDRNVDCSVFVTTSEKITQLRVNQKKGA